MQDDNLQHMEYLLTEKAFDDWFNDASLEMIAKFFREDNYDNLKEFYLKEHGLPLDSVIKE